MKTNKILIADDVKFFLDLQKTFLKRTACEVLMATDGKTTLELARTRRPDMVIVDLFMPELNGDECCKKMKEDPALKDIPVILVYAAGKEEEKGKCILAGCDDYITKPINGKLLLDKVKKLANVIVRDHVRASIDAEASYRHEGVDFQGRIKNVSEGGVFIETPTLIPAGSHITGLGFSVPGEKPIVDVDMEVVRTEEKRGGVDRLRQGMGARFLGLSEEDRRAIARYVRSFA